MRTTATRYHDFCAGHRVLGHESKCAHLHGHNYRVEFSVEAPALDSLGRVIDFSVIKTRLCEWLEVNWDHRFLVYTLDPLAGPLQAMDPAGVVIVDFNPTAENLAGYLLEVVGPTELLGTGADLVKVRIWETRKCDVSVERS